MAYFLKTIDRVSSILCESVERVLNACTKKTITYSSTIQSIPKITMKPDIGCFVTLSGDYNGLLVMNFSGNAAMTIYKSYMISMGLPENELSSHFTSNDVTDSIGEIVNQIMGEFMRLIAERYTLVANFGQPKVLALNSAITLTIDSDYRDNRRISFSVEHDRFQLELALEQTEFIILPQELEP
jgi:CheY-specific phosphatase CheX